MKTKKNIPSVDLSLQVTELKEKLARSMADYINLEKRIARDRDTFSTLITTSIISQLLEVIDDLNLAYAHLQDQGLKMAIDKLINILKSYDLKPIEAENIEFDPKIMECIGAVDGKADFVVSVERPGYLLNGNCLRPARVIVGKSKK